MIGWIVGSVIGLCVLLILLNGFLVVFFLRRQRELEELALIEAKERREYLGQASARMAVQTENLRRLEQGLLKEKGEFDPMSMANRRMSEG